MRRKSSALLMASMIGMLAASGIALPEPKAPKVKKPKPQYTDEEVAELERLFEDRSSPGRKAYKQYQSQLRIKYAQV